MTEQLDTQVMMDALGHGVLVFSSEGKLVMSNTVAGTILGMDLNTIRDKGWVAAVALFNTGLDHNNPDELMDGVRARALQSERPVRFHIYRSGAYVPCWAAPVTGNDGNIYTMITLDMQDWTLVGNVIDRFRLEMRDAVLSTIGHINLINKTLKKDDDDAATQKIGRRIGGFTRLIAIHMSRADRLMHLLERLETIRTGAIHQKVHDS
ncbi:MAG: hypothetical protein ACPG7F_21570, partial [Aggregatilineales bacterium]